MAIDMNVHELLLIGDSDLLIHRVQGEWAVKNPKMHYTFFNDHLDIELKEHSVHCSHIEVELDGLPWYFDIKKYLGSGNYPEDVTSNNKKSIGRMALNFFLSGEVLYRRTPNLGLLRCIEFVEPVKIIEQIHAGVCGTHMNGLTLERKILRAGYFWMTTEHDCCKFVQKCHKYQVHGDLSRVPPHELNAMSSPWLFLAFGMDIIGQIEPDSSNGHIFILVAIDYFKKLVEATSYMSVTKKVVDDFIRNNLICRFGVPESIIIENGANLNSHLMRDKREQFKIPHQNSTAYRPQMNGAVEATNKIIKKILRRMINNYRVEIPSLRIIQEAELSNAEWVSKRIDQLTLIDEKRMDEYKGKLAPNWQGPYIVCKVLSGGALILSEMDGTAWPKPINSYAVKRYYA
ncbi:uncharacterized protein LOC107030068 [Solanum pennellii]|uniref:Uncharacterized protein LOC107030068 n=1 Tax=Solanum pennellii TaxID=28526 RepID=A0ABM1HKW6_SOLPN|nr:uncharacterized protein LOC107030068 [Solanum pennellii]